MIDKKLLSSGSSTDSYFFQVYPSYFKVEHAFAKGIKPNTTYRLAVYKGTSFQIKEFRKQMKWQNPSRVNLLEERLSLTKTCSTSIFQSSLQLETFNSQSKCWKLNLENSKLKSPHTKLSLETTFEILEQIIYLFIMKNHSCLIVSYWFSKCSFTIQK